jgi:hypothetical protein
MSVRTQEDLALWSEADGATLKQLHLEDIHLVSITPPRQSISSLESIDATRTTPVTAAPGALALGHGHGHGSRAAVPQQAGAATPQAQMLLQKARVPMHSTVAQLDAGASRSPQDSVALDMRSDDPSGRVPEWQQRQRRDGQGQGQGQGEGSGLCGCCTRNRTCVREQLSFAFWLTVLFLLAAIGAAVAGFMT